MIITLILRLIRIRLWHTEDLIGTKLKIHWDLMPKILFNQN